MSSYYQSATDADKERLEDVGLDDDSSIDADGLQDPNLFSPVHRVDEDDNEDKNGT